MNVVFLSSEFPPGTGGIGSQASAIAKYLSRHQYKVKIITARRTGDHDGIPDPSGYSVERIGGNRYFKFLRIISALRKNLNKEDVIIASGLVMLFAAGVNSYRAKNKIVGIIHGTEVNTCPSYLKGVLRMFMSRFNKIIAVSEYTASLAHASLRSKISVINNGFDPDKFKTSAGQRTANGNFPNLVTIGTVSERKGQMNLIEALPQLIREFPTIHYHLVGMPLISALLQEKARKLGVEKHVTFHGALPDDGVSLLLKEMDIFIMLSQQDRNGKVEGFGIAILEANAKSIPAIGSKGCGIEDAIVDGITGKLVDHRSAAEITEAVRDILKNKKTYEENALAFSQKNTWEHVIRKYIAALPA